MARLSEDIPVQIGRTEQSEISDIFLAFKSYHSGRATIVVGYPGLPNDEKIFAVGDALLHQSPDKGIFEIRALVVASNLTSFRITQISPRRGFIGALTSESDINTRFSDDEVQKISISLDEALIAIEKSESFSSEQVSLLSKSLDELKKSSQRLGRKDWLLVVAGTIAAEISDLAISSEQTKTILRELSLSLSWVFENAKLLGQVVGT